MDNVDLAKIIKDVKEYEQCNCNPFLEDIPVCGCGEYHLAFLHKCTIHWLGQHWNLECAFRYAIAGLSQSFNIFKYMDDEDVI